MQLEKERKVQTLIADLKNQLSKMLLFHTYQITPVIAFGILHLTIVAHLFGVCECGLIAISKAIGINIVDKFDLEKCLCVAVSIRNGRHRR